MILMEGEKEQGSEAIAYIHTPFKWENRTNFSANQYSVLWVISEWFKKTVILV